MYKNVGEKLKTVAQIICWVNIILGTLYSIYSGFDIAGVFNRTGEYMMVENHPILGIFVVILGTLASVVAGWLSGLVLYAFGELVEHAKRIDEKIGKNDWN